MKKFGPAGGIILPFGLPPGGLPLKPSAAKASNSQQQQPEATEVVMTPAERAERAAAASGSGSGGGLEVPSGSGAPGDRGSTVLAPLPVAPPDEEEPPQLDHVIKSRVAAPRAGKGKGKRPPAAKVAANLDDVKEFLAKDDTPVTAASKVAFAKLSLAPPKPEQVSEYYLDLANRMTMGDKEVLFMLMREELLIIYTYIYLMYLNAHFPFICNR